MANAPSRAAFRFFFLCNLLFEDQIQTPSWEDSYHILVIVSIDFKLLEYPGGRFYSRQGAGLTCSVNCQLW